ncbi:family 2 glycosyl transferase [Natrialba magadii ATCC 43099]|uniref:Family 2 glycosyl transferase n=1 Tax=Natrialba magadii (strain ATCC 43099 / DSM 3394 / CCM 3739 / CIP 104546 / IAM 13178 / JCM 8861 / NBRC 102185 / NCIMB 2190 / MS3) TaxID=547559 RepID=L9UL85_NATMM|nr:family 2 glycosyl transferase [Natrialba magadii ATCC 43099]
MSIVIPARNEAAYLRGALSSIAALDTAYEYEVIVVDGASTDDTQVIAREYGATVVEEEGSSIAVARNRGASHADGEWLAFVDADTRMRADYLTEMLGFVEREGIAAASSRCWMTGPVRAKLMEATINQLFPRLASPVLPGFNCVVHRRAFHDVGGFPDVPNEDTAFSRRLGRQYPTAYHPDVLVASSGRRITDDGLTGTLWHYLRLDVGRLRSS